VKSKDSHHCDGFHSEVKWKGLSQSNKARAGILSKGSIALASDNLKFPCRSFTTSFSLCACPVLRDPGDGGMERVAPNFFASFEVSKRKVL